MTGYDLPHADPVLRLAYEVGRARGEQGSDGGADEDDYTFPELISFLGKCEQIVRTRHPRAVVKKYGDWFSIWSDEDLDGGSAGRLGGAEFEEMAWYKAAHTVLREDHEHGGEG
jgi:hypothetical protein